MGGVSHLIKKVDFKIKRFGYIFYLLEQVSRELHLKALADTQHHD